MTQRPTQPTYTLTELTGCIIAAAIDVHRGLGPGYARQIYQQALVRGLPAYELPFEEGVSIDIYYKGVRIGSQPVDLVVDQVLVQCQAKPALARHDLAQTASFLKASIYTAGLLLNFGYERLEAERLTHEELASVSGGGWRTMSNVSVTLV